MVFSITYDIVTEESAEHGDTADAGFIAENMTLRDAVETLFETRTSQVDGVSAIEASEYPVTCPQWVTVQNGMEYLTSAYESRSLHFPNDMTAASRVRVCRLVDCYGT
jgi:alcohol dehydrogenase class IV